MKKLGLILIGFLMPACSLMGPKKPEAESQPVTFSEQSNFGAVPQRGYQRTTKKSLSEKSYLDENAGSLWVNDGQGAYLFSQNILRVIGDPLRITIEGEPEAQLRTKAATIDSLLKKAAAQKSSAGAANSREPASAAPVAPAASPDATTGTAVDPIFPVKTVPTRIVERLVDGNYRVRGSQNFMIGAREFRVIVTGIVRAEDFREDAVSAKSLLDGNFDIVANKRSEIIQ